MNYKMRVTPGQSRAVQEACFAHGISWRVGRAEVAHTDAPYLFIEGGVLLYARRQEDYDASHSEVITADDFIKMMSNPKPHPHAELMMQYARDAAETDRPWERWQVYDANAQAWIDKDFEHPTWHVYVRYRRKPDTIKVGKHEFPRPIQRAPEQGATYWAVYVNYAGASVMEYTWDGYRTEEMLLAANLCHLTREAAEQHAAVLNAVNRGDV